MRKFAFCLALAQSLFLLSPSATAQDQWPSRSIKLIVPFPPGGNTDTVARLTAAYMQKALKGTSVIVENRSGTGGILGADTVAKAAGDGYTICMCSIGAITIAPATQQLPYDPLTDLVPISLVSTNALVLLVHNSVKANSVQELVALARAEPDRFMYSSGGIGGLLYFAAELFKFKTSIKMTHVPYRGGAPATTALIAGRCR
jgi:tripartite-type tricarboxylate transporter receptor subunit TctC